MGTEHARRFWSGDSEYQDLAQAFEKNIVMTHPNVVTGRSVGCGFCYHCGWCASKVVYPEYRGPDIESL